MKQAFKMPNQRDIVPMSVNLRGIEHWRVIVPKDIGGEPSKRRHFKAKADANRYCQLLTIKRHGVGRRFLSFSEPEQASVLRCIEQVGGVASLEKAVESFLRTRPQVDCTIQQLITECTASKKSGNLSPKYLSVIESDFRLFGDGRLDLPVVDVLPRDIEEWINGVPAAASRQSRLKNIRTLFSFAVKRGYCVDNPGMKVDRPRGDNKPPGILTIDEAERLMRTCEAIDPKLAPMIALILFSAVRPYEAEQCQWSEIHQDYVEVTAAKAKVRGRRRLIPMNETTRAWLDTGGDLPVKKARSRLDRVKEAAKIPWCHDILRHSFATYHYATFRDRNKTCDMMGNSKGVLDAHYLEAATKSDAEKFWQILPKK